MTKISPGNFNQIAFTYKNVLAFCICVFIFYFRDLARENISKAMQPKQADFKTEVQEVIFIVCWAL